jgi:WXG100 protein secretion system (Wss), protein YukD
MAALLVTVVGDRRRLDLVVPAEVPVADLLAPLAALLAADPPATGADPPATGAGAGPPAGSGGFRPGGWRLGPAGGEPLPPERSLAAGGVGDGAVLVLWDGTAPPPEPGPAATTRFAAAGVGTPPPRRCVTVAVVSAAGGAGRTTATFLLAGALAAAVGDLVVAVDADPGPGSLTGRLAPGHEPVAEDLPSLLEHPDFGPADLAACLAGSGPTLLPSRPAPPGVPPADQGSWARLLRGLGRHAATVVVDCGPGLGDPAARAAWHHADQFVLVTEPQPSRGSQRVAAALADAGLPAVAVAGHAPAGLDPAVVARRLPGVRGVVALPAGPAAGPLAWPAVPPPWFAPARRLAALLMADWPALGLAVVERGGHGAGVACSAAPSLQPWTLRAAHGGHAIPSSGDA